MSRGNMELKGLRELTEQGYHALDISLSIQEDCQRCLRASAPKGLEPIYYSFLFYAGIKTQGNYFGHL